MNTIYKLYGAGHFNNQLQGSESKNSTYQWRISIQEDPKTGRIEVTVINYEGRFWRLTSCQIKNLKTKLPYEERHLKELIQQLKGKIIAHSERFFTIESENGIPKTLHIPTFYGLPGGNPEGAPKKKPPYLVDSGQGYELLCYTYDVVRERILNPPSSTRDSKIEKQPVKIRTESVLISKEKEEMIEASKRTLDALHLDLPSKYLPKPFVNALPSYVEGNRLSHEKSYLSIAWPFRKYMDEALYNNKVGYYSSGQVRFDVSEKRVGGDFATAATMDPCLAYQLAIQSFVMWKTMVESKDLSSDEPFDILELGAGVGMLSHNILTFLETQAKNSSNPLYNQFWKVVRYKIGEISPSLKKMQEGQNEKWIQRGKLSVVSADATHLAKTFPNKSVKGLILSNELVDAFPVHQVHLNNDRQVEVLTVIPTLKRDNPRFNLLDRTVIDELLGKSTLYRKEFHDLLTPHQLGDRIVLSCQHLEKLPKEMLEELEWHHVYLPADLFPDVKRFIQQFGSEYFEGLPANKPVFINTHIQDFMEGAGEILDKGFVLSIDYGGNHSKRPDQNMRTFGRGGSKHNPMQDFFSRFGKVDLTVSVNFSLMSSAGEKAQLSTVALMTQDNLSKVLKEINENEYEVVHMESTFNFSEFKVLVQQNKTTKALFAIPARLEPVSFFELFNEKIQGVVPHLNTSRMYARALYDFLCHSGLAEDLTHFKAYCLELYGSPLINEEIVDNLILQVETYPSHAKALESLVSLKESVMNRGLKHVMIQILKQYSILKQIKNNNKNW